MRRIRLNPLTIGLVMIVLFATWLGVMTAGALVTVSGVSGYQGWKVEFSGLVINGGWGSDTRTFYDKDWNYNIGHLYYSGEKLSDTPWVSVHDQAEGRASVVNFGPAMSVDPDYFDEGFANFVGALDAIPTALTGSVAGGRGIGYQTRTEPYASFTWEYPDPKDPTSKRVFVMHLWVLEFNFDIGVYPGQDEERCVYSNPIVWLELTPRDVKYFLENPDEVHFGIGAIEVSSLTKHSRKDDSNSPYPIWCKGFCFPWQSQMTVSTTTTRGRTPEEFWQDAISWENTLLDPSVFITEPVYIPALVEQIGCWRDSSFTSFLTGLTVKGDLASTTVWLHTFVVGEWKVKKEIDVDWEGLDQYYEHEKGLFDVIGDFFSSPFGMFLSLIFLAVALLVILIIIGIPAVCLMSAIPKGRESKRVLDIIRKFRDNKLKDHLLGRIAMSFYYHIVGPLAYPFISRSQRLRNLTWYKFTLPISKKIGRCYK